MDENQKYEDQNQTEDVEEKKSPAEELGGELIENAIILGLAFCILIAATIIKNNNVTRWLYTLSFVFSGYEILYLSIVKLCKKALIIEEISILISGLIFLFKPAKTFPAPSSTKVVIPCSTMPFIVSVQ